MGENVGATANVGTTEKPPESFGGFFLGFFFGIFIMMVAAAFYAENQYRQGECFVEMWHAQTGSDSLALVKSGCDIPKR